MKKVVLYVLLCACVRGREREECVREKDCNNALDASYDFTEMPLWFFPFMTSSLMTFSRRSLGCDRCSFQSFLIQQNTHYSILIFNPDKSLNFNF